MKIFKVVIILALFGLAACREEMPNLVDGNAEIKLVALWDTSSVAGVIKYTPLPGAKVILNSIYGVFVKYLDNEGKISIGNLPSASYDISVRMPLPEDPSIIIVGNIKGVEVNPGDVAIDTVFGKAISSSGISINEIYACGPVNNIFFFYDQFIELYNSSDSVKYLDGMIVMRVSGNSDEGLLGPGADEGEDGDIDGVTYISKFPGSPGEKNYPFDPKTFIVLACDAVNHKNSMSAAVDLSNADWEFYNQYSANDIDNPNVKNLINMRSDKTVDFLISLVSDVIVVASGVDTVWSDGIDISTIIDGVEYQTSSTVRKTLDNRVDRGWVLSPSTYSGRSMRRREVGEDTNDGTLDFEITNSPTPGYH
ncbi:MAG: DUF4876 domain-containing protein [bacterium]